MKKQQWITIGFAVCLVAAIFIFGRTVPEKKTVVKTNTGQDANGMADILPGITTDSILVMAKKHLTNEQLIRLNTLEHSISRGNVKDQQLHVYHQLARFWYDSGQIFEPYAWYEAEAARLENSGKSLTFAARLFLENLQSDEVEQRRQWKALQAKDLFERSLKINPDDDSAKVGLGACYMFGNISATPMTGISKIREVVEKDSTNVYAQMMLIQGSLKSGQFDKAISRLLLVNRLEPANEEAIFLLADTYDRTRDRANAVLWYRKFLQFVKRPEVKAEIEKRIKELSK